MTNRHGEQVPVDQLNVLPAGLSVEVVSAVGLAFLGFAIVVLLDRVASSRADDSNSSLG